MSDLGWRTALRSGLGPETLVEVNISGPFRRWEHDILTEYIKLLARIVAPEDEESGAASEATRAGDGRAE